jgi:hypothetical protein
MVRELPPSALVLSIPLRSDRRIPVSFRLIPALLVLFSLFALVLAFPISMAAATRPADAGGKPANGGLGTAEVVPLVTIALFFALLGLLKEFRRYRGLLHVLTWNFYCWVYLGFTMACIFAVDYYALLELEKFVQNPGLMTHLSLALGHTGVSAAFAYTSPLMLSVIPSQVRAAPTAPSTIKPDKEKPATDINVVYAAIRESLENRVNGKVLEWTDRYSWPVIRSTGRMLLADLRRSGMISHEECDSARLEEGSYQQCADTWDNRQMKYELLRIMMTRSSYHDLSSRLERTSVAERVGTTP